MRSFIIRLLFLAFFYLPLQGVAQVGSIASNFTATDTHGNTHTLYEYLEEGKTVVLDFFYTTCIPCQFYAPQVNLTYEKYGCNTADVVFMSINFNDTDAQVRDYEEEFKIEFPSIGGQEGGGNQIVEAYGVSGFPTFYVIDPATKTIVTRVDPPTLQVFNYEFGLLNIEPAECSTVANEEIIHDQELEFFPNPSVGNSFYIRLPEYGINEGVNIEITNTMGQIIYSNNTEPESNDLVEIGTSSWSSGIYLINVLSKESGKIISDGKFIK